MKTDRQPESRSDRQRSVLFRYAGLGVELAAAIVGLTLAGLWIDHKFDSGPTGVLVGAGLGIVGGLYNLIKAAMRLNAELAAKREKPPQNDDEQREQ